MLWNEQPLLSPGCTYKRARTTKPIPELGTTTALEEKGKHLFQSNVCSQAEDTCEMNSDAIATSEFSLSQFSKSPGLYKKQDMTVCKMGSSDSGSPQHCVFKHS